MKVLVWTNPATGERLTACGTRLAFYWAKPGPHDPPLLFNDKAEARFFSAERVRVPCKVADAPR